MKQLTCLLTFFLLAYSFGQDLVVNTEIDTVDANDGIFSLREAVESANTTAGKQIIRFNETVFHPGANRIIYLKKVLELIDDSGVDISAIDAKVTLDGSQIDSSAHNFKDAFVLQGGNNEIANIIFQNFTGSAIVIDSLNTGGNTIGSGNQISKCHGAGIKVIDSENNTITGNDIWNCGSDSLVVNDYKYSKQDGIMLLVNADNNSITGNNCWANYGSGIGSYKSSNNSFNNNYCAINNQNGIDVYEGNGNNMITENDILANAIGILLFGSKNNNNQIIGNSLGDETLVPQKILASQIFQNNPMQKRIIKSPFSYKITKGDGTIFPQTKEEKGTITNTTIIMPSNAGNTSAIGIQLLGTSDILIADNYLTDISSFGIFIQGMQYIDSAGVEPDTIYAFPCNITIEQNRFERLGNFGIYFSETHDILFEENVFNFVPYAIFGTGIISFDPRDAGLDSTDRGTFTVANNILFGGGSGIYGIILTSAEAIHIENNEIDNFLFGLHIISSDTCLIIKNSIRSIQEYGIYTINNKNNIIKDNLLENNKQFGISINGEGDSNQYQSADVINNTFSSAGSFGIFITNVTSGIIKSNHMDYVQGYGISVNLIRNASVDSNQVLQSFYAGIAASNVDTLKVRDNIIKDQIQLSNIQITSVKFIEMYRNQFRNGAMGGLVASSLDSLILCDNIFRDSGQIGAQISDGLYSTLLNNDFSGNRIYGLSINDIRRVKVKENNIVNNSYGIYTEFIQELEIRHNNIIENLETGLVVKTDSIASCDSNYFAMNNTGLSVSGCDSIQLRHNSFVTNKKYGVFNGDLDSIDARWNYWGHIEGPTVGDSLFPGSKLGDKIGGPIIYKPFLAKPVFTSTIKPEITSIDPNESEEAGGATADMYGYNFMPDLQVLFGSDTVKQITYISLERLQLLIPPGKGGYYDVIVINPNGQSDTLRSGFYYIPEEPLVIQELGLPLQYALHQNYPNPFNPSTTIRYDIVNTTHVELSIYTIAGRKVATLVNQQQTPGRYTVIWRAKDMASGLYFYTIRSEHFTKTRKLILLK